MPILTCNTGVSTLRIMWIGSWENNKTIKNENSRVRKLYLNLSVQWNDSSFHYGFKSVLNKRSNFHFHTLKYWYRQDKFLPQTKLSSLFFLSKFDLCFRIERGKRNIPQLYRTLGFMFVSFREAFRISSKIYDSCCCVILHIEIENVLLSRKALA